MTNEEFKKSEAYRYSLVKLNEFLETIDMFASDITVVSAPVGQPLSRVWAFFNSDEEKVKNKFSLLEMIEDVKSPLTHIVEVDKNE